MGLNVWCIFTLLLLVSVGASRYDQGPQKFYDVSSDSTISEQNENKEVILYLTPDQVSALEAGGAVVRPAEDPENDEAQTDLHAEPQVNEDQEDDEQDENEEDQEEEEPQEEEQESPEDIQNQDIDFEDILRILNEQQVEEEEATKEQARNEPQVEEENTEAPRNFSPRITLRQQQQQQQQQQQEQRYLAPAVANKEQILKSYSYIRYQPNEQPQRINIQLLQQQQEEAGEAEESNEEPQTEVPAQNTQGRKKYKLIPYEVEETPEEPAQEQNVEEQVQQNSEPEDDAQRLNELVTPLLGADRLTETIGQRKNRLLQNELRIQTILRELKGSPKYNDQKYAIEIERLRANVEKQNTQRRAEAIAKAAPAQIKQQLNKKRLLSKSAKKRKGPARDAEAQQAKPLQPKSQRNSAPSENARPIPVPVIKVEKTEVQRPIPVPVETSKRLSVKNVYVRTRTDKPYIVSRKVPENRRQNPIEVPKNKPERITILRHIWEQ